MNPERPSLVIHLLLVEDNPGDARLIQEVLKDSKILNQITVISDGEEALAFLDKRGEHRDAVRPDLIVLDLNLPKKGGHEVLAQIKGHPELKRIPVVALSSSEAEEDVLRSYDLHVNCYVTKPIRLEEFSAVVKAIENFWFTVVRFPIGQEV